jgi:hypothetical protein
MAIFKYLNYIPKPINLRPDQYDLVDDEEFSSPDDRIPLFMVTQGGIFPFHYTFKGKRNYSQLVGFENQFVAFVGRPYLSNRENPRIIAFHLDETTLNNIRNKTMILNLKMWEK